MPDEFGPPNFQPGQIVRGFDHYLSYAHPKALDGKADQDIFERMIPVINRLYGHVDLPDDHPTHYINLAGPNNNSRVKAVLAAGLLSKYAKDMFDLHGNDGSHHNLTHLSYGGIVVTTTTRPIAGSTRTQSSVMVKDINPENITKVIYTSDMDLSDAGKGTLHGDKYAHRKCPVKDYREFLGLLDTSFELIGNQFRNRPEHTEVMWCLKGEFSNKHTGKRSIKQVVITDTSRPLDPAHFVTIDNVKFPGIGYTGYLLSLFDATKPGTEPSNTGATFDERVGPVSVDYHILQDKFQSMNAFLVKAVIQACWPQSQSTVQSASSGILIKPVKMVSVSIVHGIKSNLDTLNSLWALTVGTQSPSYQTEIQQNIE